MILRADERHHSEQPGIESWHCFSAGGHYDPANVSFGALIGLDEHLVAPDSGFDWHAHRGVVIVSWVLAGRLQHEDGDGGVRLVEPGEVFVQRTGSGIRHRETNPARDAPLRLVQMTLLGGDLGAARFAVWNESGPLGPRRWFVFVGHGSWQLGDVQLAAGDSARGEQPVTVRGRGQLLVWRDL